MPSLLSQEHHVETRSSANKGDNHSTVARKAIGFIAGFLTFQKTICKYI